MRESGCGLCRGGPHLWGILILSFYCCGDFREWLMRQRAKVKKNDLLTIALSSAPTFAKRFVNRRQMPRILSLQFVNKGSYHFHTYKQT